MERPKNLNCHTSLAIIFILLFHVVGLIGFLIPSFRPLFLRLVPYHLLLMMGIIVFSHQPLNARFILFMLIVCLAGYAAEWVGVHTGFLFGDYGYGNTLGFKVNGIPLTIGVNWFLLIYATSVLLQRRKGQNRLVGVAIGAGLLVLLDLLIEPVAIRFNYWHWVGNAVPVKNYICWFLFSAILLFVFDRFAFKRQSIVAIVLLLVQFLFFTMLQICH